MFESSLPNEDMALHMIWKKNSPECLPNLPAVNGYILIEQPPALLSDRYLSLPVERRKL